MNKKYPKNQESKKVSVSPKSKSVRKRTRKTENPVRFPPIEEPCSGSRCSSTRICRNSACRAVLSIADSFCKMCSCCICQSFDDNKDPSLWLECASDSPAASCGLSCHIECALHRRKVGVVDHGQLMQLDGSYCCASCGKISGILGYWKKQLAIAKDSQRVDNLCYRIYLSFRLLDGTSKFKDLHEIVKDAKIKLETEVGPLSGVYAKMARGNVSKISVAREVQELCNAAIEKADELSATLSNANLNGKGHSEARCLTSSVEIPHKNPPSDVTVPLNEGTTGEQDSRFEVPDLGQIPRLTWVGERGHLDEISGADLNGLGQTVNPDTTKADEPPFTSHEPDLKVVRVPDLNGVAPNDSCRDEAERGSGGSENWAQQGPNGEVPAVDSQAVVSRKRPASTVAHDCSCAFRNNSTYRGGTGNLDDNYEHCVKTIRSLECQGYLDQEFRKRLLTWYSLWSTEHERRVVNTFIQTLADDPRSLAAQLVDSFAYIINSKKPVG